MHRISKSSRTPWWIFFLVTTVDAATIPRAEFSVRSDKPISIRVRLAEAIPRVEVRGLDLKIGGRNGSASVFGGISTWQILCQNGRVRASNGSRTMDFRGPISIETPAGFLHFQGQPYRDSISVYSIGSSCEVINEVNLEKYLDGLVNSEFSAKWNEESIAAQVVAARTYAYHQIRKARASRSHFDVDATVKDQVYDGSIREDYRSSRAVEKSRGLVLTVGAENTPVPIKAFYHSTCGGRTELPENVWGQSGKNGQSGNKGSTLGFRRTVSCPFCVSSPRFRWDADYDATEVVSALIQGASNSGPMLGWPRDWLSVMRDGRLLDIQAARHDAEGRVTEVNTVWADRHSGRVRLLIPAARFRDWLGAGKLRSTIFRVVASPSNNGNRWRFEGRGNGHGVGMCQWGAKTMGERGYSMAAILKRYYPDAILRKLW